MIPAPVAVNVATAAMLYGVSEDVIRAAIRAHRDGHDGLRAAKIGARWSILRSDLDAWYRRETGRDAS